MERTSRLNGFPCPIGTHRRHRRAAAGCHWRLASAAMMLMLLLVPSNRALGQDPSLLEEKDLAVRAVLQSNPSTPAEWVEAADILRQLGRLDLAKQFVDRLDQANLDDQQLLALGEQIGAPPLLKLAARPELNPQARKLADAVLRVLRGKREDPEHITGLVEDLADEDDEAEPADVMAELRAAGEPAVGPILLKLAAPEQADRKPALRGALVELGHGAVAPLLGALATAPPEIAAEAAGVLTAIGSKRATLPLLAAAFSPEVDPAVRRMAAAALRRQVSALPSPETARELLARNARNYFDRGQPVRGVIDDRITFWQWDHEQGALVPHEYDEAHARRVLATRLARAAHAMAPEDPDLRRLHLATSLERARFETGLDRPLPGGEGSAAAEAAEHGLDALEEVLTWSMANDHPAAASAAARLLGRLGTPGELLQDGARPTPLTRALVHPDRRVRLAALEAIVALQPREPFAGSNHVAEALAFMLRTSGRRRALVAAPKRSEAMRLAGLLSAAGFQVDAATTGRELVQLATTSPDYELALIEVGITDPPAGELLQKLRYDYRSADLPVDLVARDDDFRRGETIARDDPLTVSFPWPHDEPSLTWQLGQLQQVVDAHDQALPVPFDARQAMARRAAELLMELSAPPAEDPAAQPAKTDQQPDIEASHDHLAWFDLTTIEDSVHEALRVPALADDAVVLLGRIGTPRAQAALVELAGRSGAPIDLREAAADALGRAIRRHGILLTSDQLRQQYERYNASRSADPAAARVLGKVLDYLEAPTNKSQPTAEPEPTADR